MPMAAGRLHRHPCPPPPPPPPLPAAVAACVGTSRSAGFPRAARLYKAPPGARHTAFQHRTPSRQHTHAHTLSRYSTLALSCRLLCSLSVPAQFANRRRPSGILVARRYNTVRVFVLDRRYDFLKKPQCLPSLQKCNNPSPGLTSTER